MTDMSNSNIRKAPFGDFGRSTGDEGQQIGGGSQGLSNGSSGKSWIWGNPNISAGFNQSKDSGDFEGTKQGSSSLLPGSDDHQEESWQTKWQESTSPNLPAVGSSQVDLTRSPVRIRGGNTYENTRQPTEVPRSSSPFAYGNRSGVVGQLHQSPPSSKNNLLDPSSVTSFDGPMDFAGPNNRGYSNQRFAGGPGSVASEDDRRQLGAIISNDDSNYRRGRGFSNSRVQQTVDLAASRSESLPPTNRSAGTPGVYHPGHNEVPGFSAYTHVPTSNPVNQAFQSTLQDLTRQAELTAQVGRVSLEDDDQYGRQMPNFGQFGQNHMAQTFNEFQMRRQFVPGAPWPQQDDQYRGRNGYDQVATADQGYELYNDRQDRNGALHHTGHLSVGDVNLNGDRARGFASPTFANTPPSGLDQYRSASRGPQAQTPQGHFNYGLQPEALHQQLFTLQNQQQQRRQGPPRDGYYPQGPRSHAPSPYDVGFQPFSGTMSPMPGVGPQQMSPYPPTQPARGGGGGGGRQEEFSNLRSVLLEEFRSNAKSNRRYELKDIYQHVVEFSGDQHGSRFIQQKLETANSDEKEHVFQEIRGNGIQLMTDVFGNYVIQKFFEHGNQLQKGILAKQMEGHVLTLSLQMYGCRVVQKALEHVLTDQQAILVKELHSEVIKCVKDQNGNHVIQKTIERVPPQYHQFIVDAFKGQVQSLSSHPYGCRVIQRMLEHCNEEAQDMILQELHTCTYQLSQDQYGNYVTQHVIEHGKPADKEKMIAVVIDNLFCFAKHKFASNVVEKAIKAGNLSERKKLVEVVTMNKDGQSNLQLLMRDQYGNYVIQKLLTELKGAERDFLIDQIKLQLPAVKKYTYGKQINAIEKLVFSASSAPSQATSPLPGSNIATPPTLALEVISPVSSNTSNAGDPSLEAANDVRRVANTTAT